jgi:hypothetical protein|tara:strand:- start:18 stop:470 length:453 start_codon:yes stop_codon:yes gene_type:complete
MATTVNNTTVNTRLTIIFDSEGNLDGNGPAKGSGNTESDVYLDDKVCHNLRSHTEIDVSVHALQWDAANNNGHIEYTDSRDNTTLTELPSWVTNVVIRVEAEDKYTEAYNTAYDADASAGTDDDTAAVTAGTNAGVAARNSYLSGNSITY